MIAPLCSIAIFLLSRLYFFNKLNIDKFDLIETFLPFNCIFLIIQLINLNK